MPPKQDCKVALSTATSQIVSIAAVLNLAVVLAAHAASNPETAAVLTASEALRAAVTVDGMVVHLAALEEIADAHGGTRAAGSPGHEASVDYVAGKLREAGCGAL
jgi:hypothetical protein